MPPWESLAQLSLFTQTTSFPVCLDLREAFCLKKDSLKACGAVHKQQPNFGMKNSFLEWKKEIQWESIIIDALKREGRKDTGFVLHFGREWCMATKQNSFIKQIFSPWIQNTNCMLLSSSHSGMKVKNADMGWLALGAISHSWCICLILCVFEGPLLRTCMRGCSF